VTEQTIMQFFERKRSILPGEDIGRAEEIFRNAMIRSSVRLFWAACWSVPLVAQTQVDLRTQSKSVDFQAAAFTKPFKSGSTLPLTCTQRELFFLISAAPGTNVYGCPNGGWVSEGAGELQ
jgi:hypothetical protein